MIWIVDVPTGGMGGPVLAIIGGIASAAEIAALFVVVFWWIAKFGNRKLAWATKNQLAKLQGTQRVSLFARVVIKLLMLLLAILSIYLISNIAIWLDAFLFESSVVEGLFIPIWTGLFLLGVVCLLIGLRSGSKEAKRISSGLER